MDRIAQAIDQLDYVEFFLRTKLRALEATGVERQYQSALLRVREAKDLLRIATIEAGAFPQDKTA